MQDNESVYKSPKGLEIEEKRNTGRGMAAFSVFILAAILANPNFMIVDIFPDFIAYFIIAKIIGRYADLAPYFAEVKDAAIKLGFISLAKIPASLLMFYLIGRERDIAPLFTLVFVTIEAIVLIPVVRDMFSALFYVGERSGVWQIISPFRLFGMKISTKFIQFFATMFAAAKLILNLIPELCLLTVESTNVTLLLRRLYPILEISSMGIIFLLGIFMVILAVVYAKHINSAVGLRVAIYSIVSEGRVLENERKMSLGRKLGALTWVAFASVLLCDFSFPGRNKIMTSALNGGLPLIPRCLYVIFFLLIISRIFSKKRHTIPLYVSGGVYAVVSIIGVVLTSKFLETYTFDDLESLAAASNAYMPIEIASVFECLSMILFSVFLTLAFRKFLYENAFIREGSGEALLPEWRTMLIKGYIFTLFPALISVMKMLNTFFVGNPTVIFTDPTDVTQATIFAPTLPYFGTVTFIACLLYVAYSFYYLAEVKAEMKLRQE